MYVCSGYIFCLLTGVQELAFGAGLTLGASGAMGRSWRIELYCWYRVGVGVGLIHTVCLGLIYTVVRTYTHICIYNLLTQMCIYIYMHVSSLEKSLGNLGFHKCSFRGMVSMCGSLEQFQVNHCALESRSSSG